MNEAFEATDLEAEPIQMESVEDFQSEEAGPDMEWSMEMETDGEFDQEAAPPSAARPPLSLQSRQVQQALQRRRAHNAAFVKAIGTLNKYVSKHGGIYRLNFPARSVSDVASKLKLPPNVVQMLLRSMKQKNTRLRAAGVTQSELEIEAPGCAGRTAFDQYWWGRQLWLDECQTKTLIAALKSAAAGGGGCAALIPHPYVKIACGAIGALSGVSAYGIEAIDAAGGNQGVIIYLPWLGGGWVWHQ